MGSFYKNGFRHLGSVQTSAPSLTSCVTFGKLLNWSEPQFPHLQNGYMNSFYFIWSIRGINRFIFASYLELGSTHGSGPHLSDLWGGLDGVYEET